MRVWRICKQRHAATAFSGDGARLFSARWHSAGVAMVYAASSLSLAAMEVFVNLDPFAQPDDLVSVAAVLPVEDLLEEEKLAALASLPSNWRRVGNSNLQRMGDAWIRSMTTLTMPVPSAVVEGEWNFLVNPAHPDAAKIKLDEPKPFKFDTRMFRRKG